MLKKISTVGDSYIVCDFGEKVDLETNSQVIKLFYCIKNLSEKKSIKGLLNCTPSYNKLLIHFNLEETKANKVIEDIKSLNFSKISKENKPNIHTLPICYDEEFALDIGLVEKKLKMSFDQIIKKHQETNFFIYMIGFVPGHPFMGDLEKELHLSRLQTPRVKVPKGSVGIVEKFCNVYTFDSPGGWNIVGKTPVQLFDINKKNPSVLSPGDTVKFQSINKLELKSFK